MDTRTERVSVTLLVRDSTINSFYRPVAVTCADCQRSYWFEAGVSKHSMHRFVARMKQLIILKRIWDYLLRLACFLNNRIAERILNNVLHTP